MQWGEEVGPYFVCLFVCFCFVEEKLRNSYAMC